MRLRVHHQTRYAYDAPVRGLIQILRLTPRNHDAQYVRHWRVEVDEDVRLFAGTDGLGNAIHHLNIEGPIEALTVTASGEVEVQDTGGVVAGTREVVPPGVFLRRTPLTMPDETIRALAPLADAPDMLTELHGLMQRMRDAMLFKAGTTDASTTAAEALAAGEGVCQDFTHVFIAAARHAGVPTRYVSGHLAQIEGDGLALGGAGEAGHEAGHAWAEALVPDLGWVGFDAANGVCVTDRYVRVAIGEDALSGAAIRGAYAGLATETMTVDVRVGAGPTRGYQAQGSWGQSQSQ